MNLPQPTECGMAAAEEEAVAAVGGPSPAAANAAGAAVEVARLQQELARVDAQLKAAGASG